MRIKSFFLGIMTACSGAFFSASSSWSELKKDCEFGKEIVVNKFYESFSGLELPNVEINQYFPAVDSSDIAIYSTPAWLVHGVHGYWQRCKRFVKAEQENNIFRNSIIQKYNNFNKFHPIQSLRSGFPKVRNIPIAGPIFAAYLTGFAWEVFQDQNKNSYNLKR